MHYDAGDADFFMFRKKLEEAGVTKEEFNLDNLAGVTFMELKHTVDAVLKWKREKEAKKNNGQ